MSTIVGKGMDKRFSQAELMGEIWGFPMSCHVLWIPGRLMTVSPATFCSYSGRLAVITSRPPHNVLELGSADNSKNIFMDLLFISPGREVRYDPRCSPFTAGPRLDSGYVIVVNKNIEIICDLCFAHKTERCNFLHETFDEPKRNKDLDSKLLTVFSFLKEGVSKGNRMKLWSLHDSCSFFQTQCRCFLSPRLHAQWVTASCMHNFWDNPFQHSKTVHYCHMRLVCLLTLSVMQGGNLLAAGLFRSHFELDIMIPIEILFHRWFTSCIHNFVCVQWVAPKWAPCSSISQLAQACYA